MVDVIDLNNLNKKNKEQKPLIVGFFDGLHFGHKKLFPKEKCDVLTFKSIPSKENNIYGLDERIQDLKTMNINKIYLLDIEMLDKNNFLNKLNLINPTYIIVGSKFKWGINRMYSWKELIVYFQIKTIKQNKISSTKIKKLIANGKLKKINKFLINKYRVSGIVIKGKQMGKKLGFPTANMVLPNNLVLLKNGVYYGKCYISKEKKRYYDCCISIMDNLVETHILNGFNKDIYGYKITVVPLKFIRKIKKTNSFNELKWLIYKTVKLIEKKYVKNFNL